MQGKLLQFRQDGKIGNVDLRSVFSWGGQPIVLVGGNNRTNDTLIFWQLDPATRRLSAPIGDAVATTSPNYGFCLYHSATSDKFYALRHPGNGHILDGAIRTRRECGRGGAASNLKYVPLQ